MKIAILSREPKSYSTKRLKAACKLAGHDVRVLNTLLFAIHVVKGSPRLFYKNRLLGHFDAVIPRIGTSITSFGTAIVRQFEQQGVFCLNSSDSIIASRDKLKAIQILSRHDVGVADTFFGRDKSSILYGIKLLGGAPIVIKLIEGTQGVGVILAESNKTAEAIVQTLHFAKQNVLIQKFVAESKGTDIRAIVVGDRVVAAMRRVAKGDEFRSNFHMGGDVHPVTLPQEYEDTAIRSAQILGLHVAGVDMLEAKDGPKVLEVNSSPGLEGIEKASGQNVADAVVEYLGSQVLFPQIDIRQRLTQDRGYGVVEFTLHAESALVGKIIRTIGLREKGIVVLSIERKKKVIPNPGPDETLQLDDSVVCYGKLSAIKAFMNQKK